MPSHLAARSVRGQPPAAPRSEQRRGGCASRGGCRRAPHREPAAWLLPSARELTQRPRRRSLPERRKRPRSLKIRSSDSIHHCSCVTPSRRWPLAEAHQPSSAARPTFCEEQMQPPLHKYFQQNLCCAVRGAERGAGACPADWRARQRLARRRAALRGQQLCASAGMAAEDR